VIKFSENNATIKLVAFDAAKTCHSLVELQDRSFVRIFRVSCSTPPMLLLAKVDVVALIARPQYNLQALTASRRGRLRRVSKKEREEREMYSQSVNNMYRVQRYIRP
jgi:hypothetical protein